MADEEKFMRVNPLKDFDRELGPDVNKTLEVPAVLGGDGYCWTLEQVCSES